MSDIIETDYTHGEKMLDINKGAAQKKEAAQAEIPGFEDYLDE
jgi:hypothetical protein